jgi:hypothetical protein
VLRRHAPHSRSDECRSSHRRTSAQAPRRALRAGGGGEIAAAGGLLLGIRLRFHNHAPQQLTIRLAFHQQAADELGGDRLGRAAEEGLGELLGERGDGLGGFGDSRLTIKRTSCLTDSWKADWLVLR